MADTAEAEHILLASAEPHPALAAARAGNLQLRLELANRMRGVRTELRLYAEGYLGVRETRAGYQNAERRFDLRHLDTRPVLTRRIAKAALRTALASLALGSLMAA